MLMKISKFNLSYLTKSCRHALSPNEKILRHIYFFVAFCDNGDRQREPWNAITKHYLLIPLCFQALHAQIPFF